MKKYKVEKERRKQEKFATKTNEKKQKTIIYANRKNKTDIEYTNMKKEIHEQASKELSKHSILGKRYF